MSFEFSNYIGRFGTVFIDNLPNGATLPDWEANPAAAPLVAVVRAYASMSEDERGYSS